MSPSELDPYSPQLVQGASGLLGEFARAGVLGAADVHVALRLVALGGEDDEQVALAVALTVRGTRRGHVLLDLGRAAETVAVESDAEVPVAALPWPEPEGWAARVAGSAVVAVGEPGAGSEMALGERPLRLVGRQLYLDRYWQEERAVAAALRERAAQPAGDAARHWIVPTVAALFPPGEGSSRQREAATSALERRLTVIAGGPGTGKTATVTRIAALLLLEADAQGRRPPLLALAAPTGKAAARLTEAIGEEAAAMTLPAAVRDQLLALPAVTLHRLLGRRPDSHSRFRHDERRRLPHDAVIVDETSMVSLSLMARLLEAVRPQSRLVLVGDPDQLTSVEAGAVLGDITGPATAEPVTTRASGFSRSIVVLDHGHRFGGAIAELAHAVRQGDGERALSVLRGGAAEVSWIPVEGEVGAAAEIVAVREAVAEAAAAVRSAAEAGEAPAALAALSAFRLLCAHRRGPGGVAGWNARVEAWLGTAAGPEEQWYPGRPLLVTENDYEVGLFNGDSGVIVSDEGGEPVAVFARGSELVRLDPVRLGPVSTLYAMTIHRSQGSQFTTAAVLLPDPDSRILTRELLYTAVTRARRQLIVAGSEAAVLAAVERPVARASGLRRRLALAR